MPDKKCPRCGLWNHDSALWCDCGYNFEKGAVDESYDKKPRLNTGTLLWFSTILFSIIFFIISLFLPPFHLSPGPDNKFLGIFVLLFGWLGPLTIDFGTYNYGFIGWYANVFLPFTWAFLVFSKITEKSFPVSRVASFLSLFASIIGTGLALCSLLLINETFTSLGEGRSGGLHNTIVYMNVGFYFWLATFIVCVFGQVANIVIGFFNSKKSSIGM